MMAALVFQLYMLQRQWCSGISLHMALDFKVSDGFIRIQTFFVLFGYSVTLIAISYHSAIFKKLFLNCMLVFSLSCFQLSIK
jgi:hypothetical protein